ncbi:hypothetical protein [Bradyrhizobium arachidis]|uniref:Uncharacterized protein n=1 Tax=Bradyrhizobium arachidis TaxID=858423 RepID=A0AAE7NMM0_9BRAD|nr:hypothetical protein [Bradyrhizobium arachidis]QOZ66950.1 hypothetical protein WN72_11970 [Bradyrhizobium arachidis]SFV13875.1 hypothetical protein SAMN05192541_120137 [Bradyrhizobium arachidis]
MTAGDLIPSDLERPDQAPTEIQFALVIARMIETVDKNPEHLRQAIYDLARYKLLEQFTHADAKDIKRAQQALETAIRGVEHFSQQQPLIAPSPTKVRPEEALARPDQLPGPIAAQAAAAQPTPPEPAWRVGPQHAAGRGRNPQFALMRRTAAMLLILGGVVLAVQQRERLWHLAQNFGRVLPPQETATASPPVQPVSAPAPTPPPAKPDPLRPTDYGIYAVADNRLVELPLLPGKAPDIRVAVSAALKAPSPTVLPNGHPKFVVFRRDSSANAADRAEVRILARVSREFSAEAAGKRPDDSEATWVIRNVSFPFRSSPIPNAPEMYELHSEDPELELAPGRYALILRGQAYDFTIPGEITDARHCIERVVLTTGVLYTDCKKP